MTCQPCKRCFVRVAELLAEIKKHPEIPLEIKMKSRAVAASVMIIGEYLIDQDIKGIMRPRHGTKLD